MSHTIPRPRTSAPLWLLEENYRLLMALCPDIMDGAKQQELDTLQGGEVQVALQERHKYMLLLTLRSPMALGVIPDLCLTLRLYLDARVAEVIGYQGVEFIPPRYLVSPRRGELRDERQQLNRMLFELLRICRPVVLPLPYSSKPPHS